jgi:predicted nuclease with RNAse H fold
MSEAKIGRVVAAALHEALASQLPMRLEFYEHWLKPTGLREGRVGIASFQAVLSFLRREDGMWAPVMQGAGEYAAEWTFATLSPFRRALVRRLSRRGRLRLALRLASRLVVETHPSSGAHVAVRRDEGRLAIDRSAFCDVRSQADHPQCLFYAAALGRFCHLLGLETDVMTAECRGMGHPQCVIAAGAAREPAEPVGAASSAQQGNRWLT